MEQQLIKLRDNIQQKMDIFTEILSSDHDCHLSPEDGCLFCETYHKYLHATRIELEIATRMLQAVCAHTDINIDGIAFCNTCGDTELNNKHLVKDMRN